MDIEKFKKNFDIFKFRSNECVETNDDKYKIKEEFYNECIMFYNKINNVLIMQETYITKLKEIINDTDNNKKIIRENVIKHRYKLKEIENEIANVFFLLEFKLIFNQNCFDFYDNSKTTEKHKIFELMLQCYNLIKIITSLIESFKLYNYKFYFDIKIIEKKMNNNYLLIISV